MDLKITHDIENNVFSTVITVDGFGTEQLSEDEEKELLEDFPSKIAYKNLYFTKYIKMNGSVPEVIDENEGDGSGIIVSIPPLSNREIVIDKDFNANYKIDINKMPNTALDSEVLKTKELVAQAYCAIYDAVIVDAVKSIMDNIRTKAPSFSGEKIVSV